jgi:Cu+-exporting ATPase
LKNKFLNIDVPIALAIVFTFVRSVYAIFFEHGAGYFDSMTGIVFFMLVGRYFQDLTYKTISFDRDYRSYFPLSVSVLVKGEEVQKPLSALENGDMIVVRNQELIPADALLVKGKGQIDYSFVTGESEPVEKRIGELVYAGGRQTGGALELKVVKEVSQSYLTQLWNNIDVSRKDDERQSFVQILGRYFALIVLVISAIASGYWIWQGDIERGLDALITPMIVACPCALLLSATFTNGNAIRYFGKYGIYLKNAFVIEHMTRTDAIVFDKTGTLTQSNTTSTEYVGDQLSNIEKHMIAVVAAQSTHPYSKAIVRYLGNTMLYTVDHFREISGAGVEGYVDGTHIRIGSAAFVDVPDALQEEHGVAYIAINENVRGRFRFANTYREGLEAMITGLRKKYDVYILSGDNDADKAFLSRFVAPDHMHFEQSPHDKLKFIKSLQQRHRRVMMLGDGLNDAGALQQSDTGIAVAQSSNFTPASDVVMDVKQLVNLPSLFRYAFSARRIIIGSFILSIIYKIIGLFFALQGMLSPVVAAILMPLSTITIVSFTTGMTTLAAKWVMGRRN